MGNDVILRVLVLTFILGFSSCAKECDGLIDTCYETPDAGFCQAYFVSWFYDKGKNKCVQIGYSGCSSQGFETLEECNACECN